jgi:hypothetical protein
LTWAFQVADQPGRIGSNNEFTIYWVIGGEPIPTSEYYNCDWQYDGFCQELRDATKAAVERGIRVLQDKQAQDPNRYQFPVMTRKMISSSLR